MSRHVFALIVVLSFGTAVLCLHGGHGPKQPQVYRPVAAAMPQTREPEVLCGCEREPLIFPPPTTPREIRLAKEDEEREERRERIENVQVALRLHLLVRIGTSRQQVKRLLGEPEGSGGSEVTLKGHPFADADYCGDYEVAYSTHDKVIWYGRD